MKHKLESVRNLAATLITFGALAGGANAAISVTGNPQVSATVQVTSPYFWTITSSGDVSAFVLNDAMSSLDGSETAASLVGFLSFTNLTTGISSNSYAFQDGNYANNNVTEGDSYFYFLNPLSVTVGDIVQLSPTAPISFADSNFDPDWNGLSFVGDTFLTNDFGIALTALTPTPVPEPSSALLVSLGAFGIVARRRRIK